MMGISDILDLFSIGTANSFLVNYILFDFLIL